jgi:hypothetical protein
VGLLRAGDRLTLFFSGPRCGAAAPLVGTADAGGAVAESNESDNALTVPCPAFVASGRAGGAR